MNIIESFLDKIQTEKLDIDDIGRKTSKMFIKVYQDSFQHCISKQKREEYNLVKPDMDCQAKSQILAYKHVLIHLNKWSNRCEDANCMQIVSSQIKNLQGRLNYLQRRKPLTKALPELPEYD
jgi:TnpA family transposase